MSPIISIFTSGSSFGRMGSMKFRAIGGTIIEPGNGFVYHVFTSSSTFQVTSGKSNIEYLVVGGGGGGGSGGGGGGGGAGGVREASQEITTGTYNVTVGTGGGQDVNGNASTFIITSTGGGRGNFTTNWGSGQPGGSGGGGPRNWGFGGAGNSPPVSPPQGNNGGGSAGDPRTWIVGGGGGGGANGGGGFSNNWGAGGPGGSGRPMPRWAAPLVGPAIPGPAQPTWRPVVGPSGIYAGGGAGCGDSYGCGGGGSGGGGGGWANGVQFTGSGAGARGTGGTGIVVIRYPKV